MVYPRVLANGEQPCKLALRNKRRENRALALSPLPLPVSRGDTYTYICTVVPYVARVVSLASFYGEIKGIPTRQSRLLGAREIITSWCIKSGFSSRDVVNAIVGRLRTTGLCKRDDNARKGTRD